MTGGNDGSLQVGFKEMVGFGIGVAVPMLLVTTALFVALFVLMGAGAGPGITVGMTAGIAVAMGAELFRRYVIATGRSGARRGNMLFRALIWAVLLITPCAATFVGIGLLSGCYGHGCDALSRSVMVAMLVLCAASLVVLPLGWRLLHRAAWLQRRVL